MKKAFLASALMLAASGTAFAQDPGVYIGVKGGSYLVSVEDTNDPTGYGALVGYNFGKGMAVEFEYTNADELNIGNGYYLYDSATLTTTALYFAYRTETTVYFKARAGILNEKIELDRFSSLNESETGLSVGAGVGVNMGKVAQLEAEYTLIEQDISLLSLGLNLRF